MSDGDISGWEPIAEMLKIEDVPSFVRVAYIHNASYLGGLFGLVAAVSYVYRLKTRWQSRTIAIQSITRP
jgi:hypothetical protein